MSMIEHDNKHAVPADERILARDPQPGAPFDQLDPALWLGDGRRRNGLDRADDEHDNTMHAGQALTAVQAYYAAWDNSDDTRPGVEAVLPAYRKAAHLDDEEEAAVLAELLCGIYHLADARGLRLSTAAEPDDDLLAVLVSHLLAHIEQAATTTWAERLGEPWQDIVETARWWYADQVRPQD